MAAVSTENQFKAMKSSHSVSQHRFISKLANGIKEALENKVPNLDLRVGSKVVTGNTIELSITGSTTVSDAEEMEETKNDVRRVIDSMKNPSTLLSTLE